MTRSNKSVYAGTAIAAHITAGMQELSTKSLLDIQRETAMKWAGRAVAATVLQRHDDAHEFAHEAVEHAALSGDDALLAFIRRVFSQYGVEA